MAHDVFISYATADQAVAKKIRDRLQSHGIRCWIACEDIPPGAAWPPYIVDAISASRVMILVFSSNSNRSQHIAGEIERAFHQNLHIVPFRIEEVAYSKALEYFLSSRQWFDAITPPLQSHLDRLAQTVKARLASLAPPTGPAQPAARGPTKEAPAVSDSSDEPGDGWHDLGPYEVRLEGTFDQDSYAGGSDPTAFLLLEAEIRQPRRDRALDVPADIALLLDVSKSMRRERRFELLEEAVKQFIRDVGSKERVAIVAFSTAAQMITEFVPATRLKQEGATILRRIRAAGELAQAKTNIVPAMAETIRLFAAAGERKNAVRRTYILTDGGFHDARESGLVFGQARGLKGEIGIYAFGEEVPADLMRRVLAGQLGGWVKPIANLEDITRNFARIAQVNRALVGQEARLVIKFDKDVTLGEVWSFRPYERHFGQMTKHQNSCDVGFPEADRKYSLLFELRLPPSDDVVSRVARAGIVWRNGERQFQFQRRLDAARDPNLDFDFELPPLDDEAPSNRAAQAYVVLDALRRELGLKEQLKRERARLKIAQYEERPDDLIEMIRKKIAKLEFDLAAADEPVKLRQESSEEEFGLSLGEALMDKSDWESGISLAHPGKSAADSGVIEVDFELADDDSDVRIGKNRAKGKDDSDVRLVPKSDSPFELEEFEISLDDEAEREKGHGRKP